MPSAKNFFSAKEQDVIAQAIASAEMHTSGEIRVHLESFCFGSEIKAAEKIFARLGMHQTKERNGILIYIATYSHKIAVIGDEGIHAKLPIGYWDKLVKDLIDKFKANKKADALAQCVVECGIKLQEFFPRQDDDTNELSNSISY